MKDTKKKKKQTLEGLNQTFNTNVGKKVKLDSVLSKNDWWELKSRGNVNYIITHNGIKKIADIAGISTDVDYSILTQPSHENNYQQTWQVKVRDESINIIGKTKVPRITTEVGEVNRNNLGSRGKNNPANMAQKRAYDRAVLRHLGIVGFLGEDELPDRDEEKMENLTPEEAKLIVDLLNEIFATKNKKELEVFSKKMLTLKEQNIYTEGQLEVLRNAWSNQLIKFNKTF